MAKLNMSSQHKLHPLGGVRAGEIVFATGVSFTGNKARQGGGGKGTGVTYFGSHGRCQEERRTENDLQESTNFT